MKIPTKGSGWVVLMIILWSCNTAAQKLELVVETGHVGEIYSLNFSRDGKLLMSVGEGDAKLWNTESGMQLHTFPPTDTSDVEASISPVIYDLDNKVKVGAVSERIFLWNIDTGSKIKTIETDSMITALALSTDAKTMISSHQDKTTRVWDVNSKMELRRLPESASEVRDLLFTPDGKSLISLDEDNNIKLWNTTNYSNPLTLKAKERLEYAPPLIISPDGKSMAALGRDRFYLWDLTNGDELPSLTLPDNIVPYGYLFSNDGKALIVSVDGAVILLDITTGKTIRTLKMKGLRAETLALSSNDLLAGGNDEGLIRVWNLKSEDDPVDLIGHAADSGGGHFSPDARILEFYMDWNKRDWFFDVVSGNRFITPKLNGKVNVVAFSPDENLYVGEQDRAVKLFDFSGKELFTLAKDGWRVTSAAFSPDAKLIACEMKNALDVEVRIWDTTNGRQLPSLPGNFFRDKGSPIEVAFSPNGKIIAGGANRLLRVWDVETGKELFPGKEFEYDDVYSLSFSPDSKKLATLHLESKVNIWDVSSGNNLQTYQNQTSDASSITFTPDGRLLATGRDETLTKIWDVVSGKELGSMAILDESDWAIVTPEGRFDASPNGMKLMHYAYGTETIDLQQLKERYYEPGLVAKLLGFNREPLREVVNFKSVELFPAVEAPRAVDSSGKLSLKLVNRGGGIGRVQIFVNDKEFTADARPKEFDPNSNQATIDLDLQGAPVIAGVPNRVRIVTYNQAKYLSSRGTLLNWVPIGTADTKAPEIYALVAGVSDYSSPQLKLHYPAKDAADIAKAFEIGAKAFFGADHVHLKLLSSDKSNPQAIPPTKANFRKVFEEFSRAKPSDVLVIYLAGHGITLPGSDTYLYLTQEARSKDGNVLSDPAVRSLTSVSSDELVESIKKVPALKQVMILDTCAAGAAAARLIERRGITGDQIRAIERLKDRTGFHVLMGSAADSVSYEATQYGQGLLTYVLLQGMSGAALRDEEYVDIQKLFQYAADEVPQLAKNVGGVQRPVVAAPSATSFDIGRISSKDKIGIPLSKVKPLVLRPRFVLQELGDDTLGLMRELRGRLRDASYFSETDKNPPKFVYVDEEELPGAVRLVGTYTVNGDVVKIKPFLRLDDRTIGMLPAVEGSKGDVPALASKLFEAFIKALDEQQPMGQK